MSDKSRLSKDRFHDQKLNRTRNRRRALRLQNETERAADAPRRNDVVPHLETIEVPIGSVQPSPHRARKTQPEQLQRVIDSVRVFGISRPILIANDGEIIDGHVVHAAAVVLSEGCGRVSVWLVAWVYEPQISSEAR